MAYAQFVTDYPGYKPADAAAPGLDAVLADWGWALIDADKSSEADDVFEASSRIFPTAPTLPMPGSTWPNPLTKHGSRRMWFPS